VPGVTPHPVLDPDGHSRMDRSGFACLLKDGLWRMCPDYLFGVDLFNHEFYWEAHETWEPLWHEAGHETGPGYFMKAMIQVSAVMLLFRGKRPKGIPSLISRAGRYFDKARTLMDIPSAETTCGISTSRLLTIIAEHISGRREALPQIELEGL
jgi:hypothetical protein